ncbi:IS4 family transposase [Reinekea marinisedimentorum]|uniref:DDE family transposase n=1 Tax=Reinekea marinisedimentorum TaxID=230495 RepID=A0A4R3HQG8_9GAMM|nr:IS4 family transposase [Reinekea marinisedimentorum]TCS33248.1 DDE family transposase [Reinekea marinisedimentorum]
MHASITPANINDINVGRTLPIETGATYVFDKGYYDYNWWFKLDQAESYFVTRFKHNAGLNQLKTRSLTQKDEDYGILNDEVVAFKNRRPGGGRINHYHGTALRRVTVSRPDKTKDLVIATNDFQRSAQEIAELYKKRWGIELFFKWLKQNLKIKRFLGRSENAVRLQIFTAIITYLLAYLSHRRSNTHQSLTLWLVELREGLFLRKDTAYATEKRRRQEVQELARTQGAFLVSSLKCDTDSYFP